MEHHVNENAGLAKETVSEKGKANKNIERFSEINEIFL